MTNKANQFTVRYWAERIAGEDGFSYEIRDLARRFRGGGWSRGSKSCAADDARAAIAKLQAPATREAAVAS